MRIRRSIFYPVTLALLGGCPRIHLEKKRTTKNRSRPVALVSFWDKKGII